MNHDVVERMVKAANPVPDHTVFEAPAVDFLLADDERRTEVETIQKDKAGPEPSRKSWGRLVPIASAIAAVVVVVIGLMAITSSDDVAGGDPIAEAESLVAAWGSYDLSVLNSIPDEADVSNEDWHNVDRTTLEDEMLYRQAVDWPFEVTECSQSIVSTGEGDPPVRCTVSHDPSWTRAQGLGPYPAEATVRFADGEVVEFRVSLDTSFAEEFFFPLRTWLSLEYPDEMTTLYPVSRTYTLIDAEARELWAEVTAAYIAQLDG